MKKVKSGSDELRAEYKRSDFGKMERGKYYNRALVRHYLSSIRARLVYGRVRDPVSLECQVTAQSARAGYWERSSSMRITNSSLCACIPKRTCRP